MSSIIARKQEIKQLNSICANNKAAFIAVYGRRRIGKTYLIKQFFQDKGLYFHLTGIYNAGLKVQLNNFTIEFNEVFSASNPIEEPENWFTAFNLLRGKIQLIKTKNEKIILFFDELPWLATAKSGFLQALEHCWNRYLCDINNVVLIVCGSAVTWMIDNIIHNKGGLHGRIIHSIRLLPFTLAESEEYLQSHGINYERKQIVDLYMSLGGVAHYLNFLERGKSVAQNINDICFKITGALFNEFIRLYHSLFKNHEKHLELVKILAARQTGYTYQELLEKSHHTSGGAFSKILKELTESGFIMQFSQLGKKKELYRYRLIDEFSLFYLKWIAKVPSTGLPDEDDQYWIKQQSKQAWRAWSGYAFEGICLKHLIKIKQALGIAGVSTIASKWNYKPTGENIDENGVEIDLVIDRADHCVNLCEIKYYNDEFTIDKKISQQLVYKKKQYQLQTKTKKSIFLTMISTYGVKLNHHYLDIIDNQITLEDLF